jgi:hypothetical protein
MLRPVEMLAVELARHAVGFSSDCSCTTSISSTPAPTLRRCAVRSSSGNNSQRRPPARGARLENAGLTLSPLPAPEAHEAPEPAYPGHDRGRRVSKAGTCRCQSRQLCSSDTRLQEDIAWEETADGIWSIDCYNALLVRLDARDFRLYA